MNQSQAREIINSLSSLYPLQEFEEEAINTLLNEKEYVWNPEEENSACPCCGDSVNCYSDNFCRKCGQPLIKEEA